MRWIGLVLLLACSKQETIVSDAGGAQQTSASAAPAPFDTRSAWWEVAGKSKVFTESRRVDADNRLKMLPLDQRVRVVRVLDDMAKLPADASGFHDAAEKARDAQERIVDPSGPTTDHSNVFRAIAETSMIVLHGLVAKACSDKADAKALVSAIRTVPLPRVPAPGAGKLSDGRNERSQIEQELKECLSEKDFKAATADAPNPAKNPP